MSWFDSAISPAGRPVIAAPPTTANYLGAARQHAGAIRSVANDGMELASFLGGLCAALALGATIVAGVTGDEEQ